MSSLPSLHRGARLLLLLATLLPAVGSHAQTPTETPLSLTDADRHLLEANPAILQARAAVAGARAGIDIAGARPNPQLSFSAARRQ